MRSCVCVSRAPECPLGRHLALKFEAWQPAMPEAFGLCLSGLCVRSDWRRHRPAGPSARASRLALGRLASGTMQPTCSVIIEHQWQASQALGSFGVAPPIRAGVRLVANETRNWRPFVVALGHTYARWPATMEPPVCSAPPLLQVGLASRRSVIAGGAREPDADHTNWPPPPPLPFEFVPSSP